MDTSFELEGGQMKTNQSNETALKVISIKILTRSTSWPDSEIELKLY